MKSSEIQPSERLVEIHPFSSLNENYDDFCNNSTNYDDFDDNPFNNDNNDNNDNNFDI